MDNEVTGEQKAAAPVNGDKAEESMGSRTIVNLVRAGEDDASHGADLSPPDSSSMSSVNPDMLGDEIIVGTHGNEDKPSPLRVVSDTEDGDTANGEDDEPVPHYPKRKRASVYNDLSEDRMESSLVEDANDAVSTPRGSQGRPAPAPIRELKGIPIGYWRDSPVPNPNGKHAVIGFMDVRDRLRTRISNVTRSGDIINARLYPVPPGPGGSWVTFDRIVFDNHLVGLNHNEIKEYVKIRIESSGNDLPENLHDAELMAVRESRRRLEQNPPTETTQPPAMAYGVELPDSAQVSRHDSKRRRLTGSISTIAERPANPPSGHTQAPSAPPAPSPSAPVQPPYPGMLDSLPGTRPTRILVGCWAKSAVDDDRERHAVYGILGANDMFRVKLVRETLDGRYVDGNFPAGAGALWIPYEEVIFLRHIAHLSRPEMKEYVRVRQSQIDAGEKEDDKVANETKAVYEAQTRVAAMSRNAAQSGSLAHRQSVAVEREETQENINGSHNSGGHELRHHRRDVMPRNEPSAPRHPLPEPEVRHIPRTQSIDPVDRVQGLATREVERMEAVQLRHQTRYAMGARGAGAMDPTEHHRQFQENRDRMQRIWASQEAARIRAGAEDAKMHMGIKYERKQNGPFAGKLVSQGAIITIDGEDYVEYRVLTKPSFF